MHAYGVVAEDRDIALLCHVQLDESTHNRGCTLRVPGLRPDATYPQHAWLSSIGATDPAQRLADLQQAPEDSADVLLARAQAQLELGEPGKARETSAQLLASDPWECAPTTARSSQRACSP